MTAPLRFTLGQTCLSMAEKPLRSRREHGIREALRFRANDPLTEVCHAIIPAPIVIQSWVRTLIRLFYQSRCKHAFQTTVKCAGTELKCVMGLPRDVEHDPVAVPFFVGQSQKNMKHRRREWKQILGC